MDDWEKEAEEAAKETQRILRKKIAEDQARLQSAIVDLERKMIASLSLLNVANRTGSFSTKNIKENLAVAQKIHGQLNSVFEETYNKTVRKTIYNRTIEKEVLKNISRVTNKRVRFSGIDRDIINVLNKTNYNQFTTLGKDAQAKIKNALYNSIAGNGTLENLREEISSSLTGRLSKRGRPMQQYADLWANESNMNLFQTVNNKKAADAGLDSFLYSGTIIKNTRDFCRQRVGKVYKKKEIDTWTFYWKGKSGAAWTNRGGWNCRHHWQAVDPDWL